MDHRSIAIFAIVCVALSAGGCVHSTNRDYDEILMPLQTGSRLHRRVMAPAEPEQRPKKKKKKEAAAPKPEAEPSATPKPEEESTPPADRFR